MQMIVLLNNTIDTKEDCLILQEIYPPTLG